MEALALPQRCPVCGSAELERLCDAASVAAQLERARRFHVRRLARCDQAELEERASFSQTRGGERVEIARCLHCSLLARLPRADAHEQRQSYAEEELPPARLEEMRASQAALYRRKVRPLQRLLGERPRVIEVGSFVGGFLQVARTAGIPAIGLDPGRQVTASCRELGLDAHPCTLEDYTHRRGVEPVDCVAIWNTFDQLPDPSPTLALAARWIRAGGILALRVPHGAGFRGLWRRWTQAPLLQRRFFEACLAWNNLLGFPYLYGYGAESLDRLIEPFGFVRVLTEGDVLGLLAGRQTHGWARREERAVKQVQRAWIAAQARRRKASLAAAPWLDVYYRRLAPSPAHAAL